MNLLGWVKHLFLPHNSNNCKAKILHPSALSVLVGFFLLYQVAINFYLLVSPSVLGFASNISPETVVSLTNQKRAEQGLAPLTINNKLNEAAQRKAGDMFAFNYWSHISPSGRSPWSFFQEVGYRYLYAGENLARDFMDSGAVVEAWMNSPTHRENIVNGSYKEIGLAVVNGTLNGIETTLVVQLFGAPLAGSQVAQKPATVEPSLAPTPTLKPAVQPGATQAAQKEETQPVVEEKAEEAPAPLARIALAQTKEETQSPPLLSPFMLTKTIAIFLLGLILGALLLDIILVYQRKIIRLSGRNVAHLIFVGGLLLAAILTSPGAIL
jgi:hypothetical protein